MSRVDLTEIQEDVLGYLRGGPMSVYEIADERLLSPRTIKRTITELSNMGYKITIDNDIFHLEDNGEERYCSNMHCNGIEEPKRLSRYNRGRLCYNCQDRLNNSRAIAAVEGVRLNTKLGDKANIILVGLYSNRGNWVCINNLSKFRGSVGINKILDTIQRNGYNIESKIQDKKVWAVIK
jgi:biotin operon repressor